MTCVDQDDSQFGQSLPIDVIQLLQCVQSGAPIPFKHKVIIITLLIMQCFVDPSQTRRILKFYCRAQSDSLTYFIARRV